MRAPAFGESIAVVGWSCRVPGADSIAGLWKLLCEKRCAVTRIPPDRFALEHFGHPRKGERGRSYTWAAGVLDDIWGFDPTAFGISPREAQQMDPQQRILLQLAWEALEDAGIRPSTLAATEVGVYVGGSVSEAAHSMYGDPSIADSHFATGNALAILANRVSYVFDLRGPSITVDTACSSSLVALHQAIQAIRSGRVDTAIVGGINVLAAPTSFVSFSQASMLSPTGLCRAFSADADGYVRAEGGAVLVLRKVAHAQAEMNQVHGIILASEVNSDGRTNGISLPSRGAQESLLRRVYEEAELTSDCLAFVEAHGTGTPAGDPIEANAIGSVLGCNRSTPLPIGSIKTNIGHLEPASGLAGVIKSVLALNHGVLPPSLHFTTPNPKIDLDALNLTVCREPLDLPSAQQQYAGVNSFGFGGTNAHVIVAPGLKQAPTVKQSKSSNKSFFISAESKPALIELAGRYSDRIAEQSDEAVAVIASAAAHQRDHRTNRLVITSTRQNEVSAALDAFLAGTGHDLLSVGEAGGRDLPIAFIYTGNGSQWKGMGRAAYRNCAAFRNRFNQIDDDFTHLSGWSLREAIFDEDLDKRLKFTSVAQPLIFAIQSATTCALRLRGLRPVAVLGHSVGEVAAAEAAGIIDLHNAVQLIYSRSMHQELIRDAGRMLAVLAEPGVVRSLIARIKGVEIAAYNSPRALTIAGSNASVAQFVELAKQRAIVCLDLNLDYPFHNQLMAPIKAPLVCDLKDLDPRAGEIPFISTVTGTALSGERLDASYWWQNVRKPVQFVSAVQATANLGAGVFLEIGPRGVLTKHISDTLSSGKTAHHVALSTFEQDEQIDWNPIVKVVAKALTAGAKIDVDTIAGPNPGASVKLPFYPWQQKPFRNHATPEAIGWFQSEHHPLSGSRYDEDALEWHAVIDTSLHPELGDHRLAQQTILPGTGFIEIALSVACQWLPGKTITLTDFETLTPLDLTGGESREVMTRISSGSRTFEIFSRPRLSQTSWTLHSRGKILSSDKALNVVEHPNLSTDRKAVSGEALYRIADASGLHYGPGFRQIENVKLHSNNLISVELNALSAAKRFLLDPVRLDCCCQGLIVLFPDLRAEERGVAYIPVRVDTVAMHLPGRIPRRSIIEILSQNERSINANFHIFDDDDNAIATLRGVRCQAVPVRRSNALETVAFVESSEPADGSVLETSGFPLTIEEIVNQVNILGLSDANDGLHSDSMSLLDGWAMMVAHEIASALAERNVLNLDQLIQKDRISPHLRPWVALLLSKLTTAKLAEEQNGSWTLIQNPLLPSSASIVKELAAKYPERAGELLIAAEITGLARRLLSEPSLRLELGGCSPKTGLEFYDIAGSSVVEAGKMLMQLLPRTAEFWPRDRSIRVLQVGYNPLTQQILQHGAVSITLTIFEPDRRKFERAKATLANVGNVQLVDRLDSKVYDLIVATRSLHLLPLTTVLIELREALAPGGLLIAIEAQASFFEELVSGLRMQVQSVRSDQVQPYLPTANEWSEICRAAGFEDIHTEDIKYGDESGVLLVVKARNKESRQHDGARIQNIHIVRGRDLASAKLADALAQHLIFREPKANVRIYDIIDQRSWDSIPNIVVQIVSPDEDLDNLKALSQACLEMKACAERLGSGSVKLWHIFHGARPRPPATLHPIQSAAWAFSRTLSNEFHHLDVRRIDISPDLLASKAAKQVVTIIYSESTETELQIDAAMIRVVRVKRFERTVTIDGRTVSAARLERGLNSNQRLTWQPATRRWPNSNEVEIEVAVTGLNFRDLMFMLRLLPDDILEDGFAGPALGFECAGTVVAVGESVKNVKVGDRVATLAPKAFSTHVIASCAQVAKLPDRISFEAAVTIPTAFITAYYSLIELAKLKRNEWVLIHAGSGAVGMAAIQIAQLQGARVIATAGAEAKRDLLRAIGVHHVLDSRSTQFVDEIRKITGSGVDVVLNSLNGDSMERSVACLATFGRFIELGKRDFVTNTHIGLRPFRKNLSYFGVDMDQIMVHRPKVGHRVFKKIMRGVENGTIAPLPYSVFNSAAVSEAFQLMQKAGHIGKIIVRSPDTGSIRAPSTRFTVNPEGTHLITGGLGGFGLATAKWLADQGARNLVLIGRRGVATDEAKSLIADLSHRGVKVLAEVCDVTDAKQLEGLFDKMHKTMPRLVGVIHSAMVLDDTIIANLSADRINQVLAPKVRGADNLDQITRNLSLDYFILFSSVVTLIGNRGQGSYVAANAYLEGLAHRRRKEGLPALAVGWGPITDVGVVARTERMRTDLQKIGGVRGMRAHEALDLMGLALSEVADDINLAAIIIAPHEAAFSADLLPILRSPTYKNLVTSQDEPGQAADGKIDLRSLLHTRDVVSVRETVIEVIIAQLAHVLILNQDDVSRVRPLSEMGLDSLMALELIMNLEELFDIQLSGARAAGNMPSLPVENFADEIIASVHMEQADDGNSDAVRFVERHIVQVEPAQIAIVSKMLQTEKQDIGIV